MSDGDDRRSGQLRSSSYYACRAARWCWEQEAGVATRKTIARHRLTSASKHRFEAFIDCSRVCSPVEEHRDALEVLASDHERGPGLSILVDRVEVDGEQQGVSDPELFAVARVGAGAVHEDGVVGCQMEVHKSWRAPFEHHPRNLCVSRGKRSCQPMTAVGRGQDCDMALHRGSRATL